MSMATKDPREQSQLHDIENAEWRESLDYVLREQGPGRVRQILRLLQTRAQEQGVSIPFTANTPYINTIPRDQEPVFPGNREIERRTKSLVRWNAMAMVVQANKNLRTHLDLRLGSQPVGSRLQPFLAGADRQLPR
jgi:pyruvate dehydrogenase E1 component